MTKSKAPIIAGVGLVIAGITVYCLDSWRVGSREGQIEHVLKNARQITTIDVPPLEEGDLIIASDVPMPDRKLREPDLEFQVDGLALSRDVMIGYSDFHAE